MSAIFALHLPGELLLTPTKIYVEAVLKTLASGRVKAVSHITGGGLMENIPRVLPPGVKVQLDATLWKIPEVFGWLQSLVSHSLGFLTDSSIVRH